MKEVELINKTERKTEEKKEITKHKSYQQKVLDVIMKKLPKVDERFFSKEKNIHKKILLNYSSNQSSETKNLRDLYYKICEAEFTHYLHKDESKIYANLQDAMESISTSYTIYDVKPGFKPVRLGSETRESLNKIAAELRPLVEKEIEGNHDLQLDFLFHQIKYYLKSQLEEIQNKLIRTEYLNQQQALLINTIIKIESIGTEELSNFLEECQEKLSCGYILPTLFNNTSQIGKYYLNTEIREKLADFKGKFDHIIASSEFDASLSQS